MLTKDLRKRNELKDNAKCYDAVFFSKNTEKKLWTQKCQDRHDKKTDEKEMRLKTDDITIIFIIKLQKNKGQGVSIFIRKNPKEIYHNLESNKSVYKSELYH